MIDPILMWLAQFPWASVPELAAFCGVDRSTISRRLPQWLDDGLVISRIAGHLLRPTQRLLVTSKTLHQLYPERHSHSGANSHQHILLGPRYKDPNGHQHPGYFNSKNGAEFLFRRLEAIEVFYSTAPSLFKGHGASWFDEELPLEIKGWRWLRNTWFIDAVADYGYGIRIYFCWVGQEMTTRMILQRYANRFSAEEKGLLRFPMKEQARESSGLVIGCADEWSAHMASAVLRSHDASPGETATVYAIGPREDSRIYLGKPQFTVGNVADMLEDVEIGLPEELSADRDGMDGAPRLPASMTAVELLNGVPKARTAMMILQMPGITSRNLIDLQKESSKRMGSILDELTGDGLVQTKPAGVLRGGEIVSLEHYAGEGEVIDRFDMHYPSDSLLLWASRRDRVSVNTIRKRAEEEVRGDHNPGMPKLRHTLQYNQCAVTLRLGGYQLAPGYRDCLYLPGGHQLVPDGRMRVTADFGQCPVRFPKEGREEVRKLMRAYKLIARAYAGKPLFLVCPDANEVSLAQEEVLRFDLPVWAVEPDQVELGDLPEGSPEILKTVSVDLDLFVEYERSAKTRKDIRRKLPPYFKAAERGFARSLLVITETDRAAPLFREEHENLKYELGISFPIVSATLEEIAAGKKSGDLWVLDWMEIPLRHAGVDRHLRAI